MNCQETRRYLAAHLDGELDLVHQTEVETHLRGCAECTKLAENLRARRTVLREGLPRRAAPAGLADKIRAQVRSAEAAAAVAKGVTAADEGTDRGLKHRATPEAAPARAKVIAFPVGQALGLAASLALALTIGYRWGGSRARADGVFDEAIGEHIRSLQVEHLTDVVSTDRHTVKPWFAGRLDFSPPVIDLKDEGFVLAGGRLDHLDGRTAAALVYRRRQHAINLFVWPAGAGGGASAGGVGVGGSSREVDRDGFHALAWTEAGLNFLVVGEIPASELGQFAEAYRAQAGK